MDNRIGLQEHAAAVRQMTKELAAYCKQYKDPYGEVREIKTAMEKALGGK